jgi:hypothetical protein
MPEETLDGIEISALVQQVGGKTVTQCMNAMTLIETGIFFWLDNMRAGRLLQSDAFQASDRERATCQDDIYTSKFSVLSIDHWKEWCSDPFCPCPVRP